MCGEDVDDHNVGSGHSPVGGDCDCKCHVSKPYTVWVARDNRRVPLAMMPPEYLENLFGYLEKRLMAGGHPRSTVTRDERWLQAVNAELDRRSKPQQGQ